MVMNAQIGGILANLGGREFRRRIPNRKEFFLFGFSPEIHGIPIANNGVKLRCNRKLRRFQRVCTSVIPLPRSV
jgi:hypothetical protein